MMKIYTRLNFLKQVKSHFQVTTDTKDSSIPLISLAKKVDYADFVVDDLIFNASLFELHNGNYSLNLNFPQIKAYLNYGSPAIPDSGQAIFIEPEIMKDFAGKFHVKLDQLIDESAKYNQAMKDLHKPQPPTEEV